MTRRGASGCGARAGGWRRGRRAGERGGGGERRQGLEAEIATLRDSLAKVEANQNARRGKLEALEARLTALAEAQHQLQSAQVDQPPVIIEGALAALYQVIKVPRGLEQAIEAALSDMVEAFIVRHQSEAIDAVKGLIAQDAPRTTVLPMDMVKQVYPLNLMREKGVVGVAAQLVRVQPAYEKLVNALLGRTIVVQDVESAVRIMRRGLGGAVTLDGLVFHPTGAITAGGPPPAPPPPPGPARGRQSLPR